jgi:hypothetical protein
MITSTHEGYNGTAMTEVFGLDARALQELHVQREYMDVPPFNQPMSKLVNAFKCVEQGRVTVGTGTESVHTPHWIVRGSKNTNYVVTKDGCNCKAGEHSQKTKYGCYHMVSVELYQRWQRALQPWVVPLTDQLPLGPCTPEEHLAKSSQDRAQTTIAPEDESAHVSTPDALLNDSQPQQEHAMAAPQPDEYIPEPEPAVVPTVVLDSATTTQALTVPTSLTAAMLEQSLTEWSQQRQVLTRFIKQHLVDGIDYGKIHISKNCDRRYDCTNPRHFSKDCLFKAGSEKFMGLMRWQATFRKDDETWEMLGRPTGVLCLICTLLTPSGQVIGEGRGARDIQKDGGDVNKAIKMCQKVAQVDAILRTGALSDAFTQDLEEITEEKEPAPASASPPPNPALRQQIAQALAALGFQGGTRAEYEAETLKRTGLHLTPDNYAAILEKLRLAVDTQAA